MGSLMKPPGPMMDKPFLAHALGKQRLGAETELRQHHEGHEGHARQQQHGLDDLHPGGGRHAAKQHVHHHQRAHDDHGHPVFQTEQQLDQLAGAHHLGDQVEGHHHQRARSGKGADGGLLEAITGHVGKGELAQVAQALGHQEGDDGPAHQEAQRVDQAVVARRHHRRRNTQERGSRHVVARNGQAVLKAGDAATAGIEVRGRLGLGRCPLGDVERAGNKGAEHHDGRPVGGLLGSLAHVGTSGVRARCRYQAHQCQQDAGVRCVAIHLEASFRISLVSVSNSPLARRT